jgi:hypothetical protein
MHEIRTEIDIDASLADVWGILTDFRAYPEWNPFIRAIDGRLDPGSKLKVRIEVPGSRPMNFRPRILLADPQRELRWLGRFLLPYIFDGEHRFALELNASERITFRQSEQFRGLLVPFLRGRLDQGTRAGFAAMNQAMKLRAEALAQANRAARVLAASCKECTIIKVSRGDSSGKVPLDERIEEPCTVIKLPGDNVDVSARIGSAPEYPTTTNPTADAVLMLRNTTRAGVGDMIAVAGWKLRVSGISPGFDSIGKLVRTVVEATLWE